MFQFTYLSLVVAVLLAAASSGGCAQSLDEHAEHHDPPHFPGDFVVAVERLRSIQVAASKHEAISSAHPDGDVVLEAADLLHWLPQLAADSDLKRADWNEMYESTSKLRSDAASWRRSPKLELLVGPLKDALPGLERHAATIRQQRLNLGEFNAEPTNAMEEGSES